MDRKWRAIHGYHLDSCRKREALPVCTPTSAPRRPAVCKGDRSPREPHENADLASDRAGRIRAAGRAIAREQPTPKLNAACTFAQMLAKELYMERSHNKFRRTILVAPASWHAQCPLDRPTGPSWFTDCLRRTHTKVPRVPIGLGTWKTAFSF